MPKKFYQKKMLAILITLVMVLTIFGLQAFASVEKNNTEKFDSQQILVKFSPLASEDMKKNIHKKHGGELVEEISGIQVEVVKVKTDKVLEAVEAYGKEKEVLFAEPDYIATTMLTPNDPSYTNQWGLPKIQAPAAWDITTGSSTIRIAILDTGIDQNHQDLATKLVANKNFTTSKTVDDNHGHGTHVAGIAAAITNNGIGVAGTSWHSTLMNGKVLGDNGSGQYSWIASGIIWAADNGAKVINLSLGGSSGSQTLLDAVNYAWNKGVVLVAAAGNDNISSPSYPAYYDNCIAVAATDANDAKASFSNFGSWVDVAAPGVSIFSTLPNHNNRIRTRNYGSLSGTSMSSPFVAGVAGLVWATTHGTTNTNVRQRIQSTADESGSIWTTFGLRRVNVFRAVAP